MCIIFTGIPIVLHELAHFFRHAPTIMSLQKQYGRAEFVELLGSRVDAQGYAAVRLEVVRGLHGRVLDVGCGTGGMFPYYDPELQVDAIEPDDDFRELAAAKAARSYPYVRVAKGDAMKLAFPDGSFDAVVLGLVLCSVPSVEQVLAEVRRVLRRNGELRALEHVRSSRPIGGRLMDLANPIWLTLNKQGCNLNRRAAEAIAAAGFEIVELEEFQRFDTMMPAFPMQRIHARRA
jgi:ubiquinone/menaquinone biosynthesis C-methylase UbiE